MSYEKTDFVSVLQTKTFKSNTFQSIDIDVLITPVEASCRADFVVCLKTKNNFNWFLPP